MFIFIKIIVNDFVCVFDRIFVILFIRIVCNDMFKNYIFEID